MNIKLLIFCSIVFDMKKTVSKLAVFLKNFFEKFVELSIFFDLDLND